MVKKFLALFGKSEVVKNLRSILLLGVLLVMAGVGFGGCGLETVTVLNEPMVGSVDNSNHTIKFYGTSKNSEIQFKGFDLYYKFYKIDDYDSLQADMNLNISNPDDLIEKGFFKIVKSTDIQGNPTEPLIYIPPLYRGSSYTVTIDFSNIFNVVNKSDPVIYTDNSNIVSDLQIRRGVTDASGFYKSFYDYDFSSPDADLTNVVDVNPSSESIYIAFYVFSYGSDFENTYYSNACYLGYLTINLGLVQEGE